MTITAVSPPTLLQQAQAAIKAGHKQEARHLLQQAVQQNPQDYAAWLWLATVTASPRTSLEYVQRAELLRPNDPSVQKARAWAEKRVRESGQYSVGSTQYSVNHEQLPVNSEQIAARRMPQTQAVKPQAVTKQGNRRNGRFFLSAVLGLAAVFVVIVTAMCLGSWMGAVAGETAVLPQPTASLIVQIITTNNPTPTPLPPTATPVRIQAKTIAPSSHEPRATWTITPPPPPPPTPPPPYVPTFIAPLGQAPAQRPFGVADDEKWVDVDLSEQTLRAYEGDALVFETLISSGTWEFPTVTGQFRIYLRYESQTMDGRRLGYDYYLEDVPYVMYFYEDYAIHGTFWHNNFGNPMSHGCVNMYTPDAQWIFNWTSYGTVVNVHY